MDALHLCRFWAIRASPTVRDAVPIDRPATRHSVLGRRTLVVETTNLTEHTGSFDPSALQAIGTGLRHPHGALPNYGLLNILRGARAQEAQEQ